MIENIYNNLQIPKKGTPEYNEYLEYLKERGERVKEEKWQLLKDALVAECGEESAEPIVKELRDFQAMFTTDNALWMARLYEPKIGGFYCSNSARDNDEFLPDLENTYTALCFIGSSGMSEMYDGDWTKSVPEWLKKRVGDYIYSLQNEDGFFYNIQWPKEFLIANNRQPRATRDLGSAKYVLSRLGITPKYSTDIKKDEKKDEPRFLSQFDSPEAFRKYMDGIEADIASVDTPEKRAFKFYFYGNTFQSVTSYLNGNEEIKKIFIEFLEKYQNPETGVWSEVLCFDATNGLLKISNIANNIGYGLKYMDKIVETVMQIIERDVEAYPAHNGVFVVNAWSAIKFLYENILKYGEGTEEERAAKKAAIKMRILENAPSLIRTARKQLEGLKREDGSFSYGRYGGGGLAQGCPCSVRGAIEGDINGNVLAVNEARRNILKALEIGDYMVPVFSEYERVLFMNITEELEAEYEKSKN